ncbi:MAG: hypothetical protein U0800_15695 [Isosphaeraceae bacterium]
MRETSSVPLSVPPPIRPNYENPGTCIDGTFLYTALNTSGNEVWFNPAYVDPAPPTIGNASVNILRSGDAPYEALSYVNGYGNITNCSRRDDFVMTIMYNPSPNPDPWWWEGFHANSMSRTSSIWVPVGKLDWEWDAAVTVGVAGSWLLSSANQIKTNFYYPASNEDFPDYKYAIQSFDWKDL